MTILKVIFAPRFGLIYQPERRRKLRIPVDYEGVRLRTICGVVNMRKKQEGGFGESTFEAGR